ncbi:MAG TPA: hypothetical protein VIN57_07330 [Magnetovibrio sp.]
MMYFDNHLKPLGLILGVVTVISVGACGDDGAKNGSGSVDPEANHCEAAAKRLTRDVGIIQIIETKAWTQGDTRNVRVRFAYPQNNPEGLANGLVTCNYAFTLDVRGDADRYPQAQSIYFRARNLSTNELLLLNMGLRGTKSQFKLN